jgi:hypothetical protein
MEEERKMRCPSAANAPAFMLFTLVSHSSLHFGRSAACQVEAIAKHLQ